ncbi:MAG: HipA domain-containing protein [Candidatus Pacearchaeota archaeon]|nr:HipA domain-containing protein [Candidatus Pacearchaeota archaeon]
MLATIQIHADGHWQTAATFESASDALIAKGIAGGGRLLYEVDYASKYLDKGAYYAVSGRYPVNFEYIVTNSWPAFLVDLLPGGAGRRHFENKGIPIGPAGDWPLLLAGAGYPPGHLRIAEAVQVVEQDSHPGFNRSELLAREENFIEYAYEHGAPVAGSSDVQGDSPKFLLVEDINGQWHAEGAISDSHIKQHWLVKFPRGKLLSDRSILYNEMAYYCVAKQLGLRIHGTLIHENNTLFIPRFDRQVEKGIVHYFGQESLYSLAGVSTFGKFMAMEELCQVIARHASYPEAELTEFILRDVLNVALGNTDNHGRNTAMQYLSDGTVRLAPLYDFAPMILDDAGIARVCRWQRHDNRGNPDWQQIAEQMGDFGMDVEKLKTILLAFGKKMTSIEAILKVCQVESALIERLSGRIMGVSKALQGD